MTKEKQMTVLSTGEKELVLAAGGKLFDEIDYTSLDNVIENIGSHSGELTTDEKMYAADAIGQFENRIVSTLKNKHNNLREFLQVLQFKPSCGCSMIFDFVHAKEYILKLLTLDNRKTLEPFVEKFNKVIELTEEYLEYQDTNRPEEPILDTYNMTQAQIEREKFKYKNKMLAYETKMKQKQYMIRKAFYTFKKDLDKNKEFKDFVKALTVQTANATEAMHIVEEKCAMAKMNVMISSADVRKILRELHEYAKTFA